MAVSANDLIRDLEVRHHVGIQRLSTGIIRKIVRLLDVADAEIVRQLIERGTTLEGSFTSVRLRYLLDAVREINRDAHVAVGQTFRQELRDLARYEVSFQSKLFEIEIGIDAVAPTADTLKAITTWRPMGDRLLGEMLSGFSRRRADLITGAIRQGMVLGETVAQIVARIRGTKAGNYRDGVMEMSRTSAERMVRTAVNHVSNAAREEFYDANADLIKGVQWVATLDTRTCLRCAAQDGRVYGLKTGPRPPLHINCRCTTTPVLKRAPAGLDLPEGTRASMNGQVSESETFGTWLRRQSAATQDAALGPTRGALFRRGGLKIDRFLDVRGNQLNLDELREREERAFANANVR